MRPESSISQTMKNILILEPESFISQNIQIYKNFFWSILYFLSLESFILKCKKKYETRKFHFPRYEQYFILGAKKFHFP